MPLNHLQSSGPFWWPNAEGPLRVTQKTNGAQKAHIKLRLIINLTFWFLSCAFLQPHTVGCFCSCCCYYFAVALWAGSRVLAPRLLLKCQIKTMWLKRQSLVRVGSSCRFSTDPHLLHCPICLPFSL